MGFRVQGGGSGVYLLRNTLQGCVQLYASTSAQSLCKPMNLEACFRQLTLDVIGKAVFNYDFDSLNVNSPLIQVG